MFVHKYLRIALNDDGPHYTISHLKILVHCAFVYNIFRVSVHSSIKLNEWMKIE